MLWLYYGLTIDAFWGTLFGILAHGEVHLYKISPDKPCEPKLTANRQEMSSLWHMKRDDFTHTLTWSNELSWFGWHLQAQRDRPEAKCHLEVLEVPLLVVVLVAPLLPLPAVFHSEEVRPQHLRLEAAQGLVPHLRPVLLLLSAVLPPHLEQDLLWLLLLQTVCCPLVPPQVLAAHLDKSYNFPVVISLNFALVQLLPLEHRLCLLLDLLLPPHLRPVLVGLEVRSALALFSFCSNKQLV